MTCVNRPCNFAKLPYRDFCSNVCASCVRCNKHRIQISNTSYSVYCETHHMEYLKTYVDTYVKCYGSYDTIISDRSSIM